MKAIVTVGLGFGDEGKGATVDYLTRQFRSDLVVRYSGGAQAAHNVVLPMEHATHFRSLAQGHLPAQKLTWDRVSSFAPKRSCQKQKALNGSA